MKVILLQDVKNQGKKDQIINVSDGYAANFLFPRKLAKPADAASLNDIKNKKAAADHRAAVEKAEAQATAARLEGIMVVIHAAGGTDNRLYGSITSKDIVEALERDHGIKLDKRKILSDEPIRTFGGYTREVKLHPDVTAKIHLTVAEKK
jgi:large subunit ribosomal protein L9